MNGQVESLIETISNVAYEKGGIDKMFSISSELLRIAERYFSKGEDELAKIFRTEARTLRKSAEFLLAEYEKNSKKKHDGVWEILDKNIPDSVFNEECE